MSSRDDVSLVKKDAPAFVLNEEPQERGLFNEDLPGPCPEHGRLPVDDATLAI